MRRRESAGCREHQILTLFSYLAVTVCAFPIYPAETGT